MPGVVGSARVEPVSVPPCWQKVIAVFVPSVGAAATAPQEPQEVGAVCPQAAALRQPLASSSSTHTYSTDVV